MSEPRWLNEREMRAWSGFLETSALVHRLVERQVREDGGLTLVQYEILHWTNESAPEQRCITELAELMITSRSGLSYQVAQLEKAGLLRRETSADDERRAMVVITEEGRRLLERTAPGHLEMVRGGLIDLLTDEQITQLADMMDTARTHLRAVVPLQPPRRRGSSAR
ncbi:MarR family winged helix-turn-helix transcriptional regulator [Actinomadura sp. NEAU-AAG7]|uniref:MarR family winged helix-turn-helix transcriptional regulator n=1 Tax=Actinomadura sp. NEAU-AAG7 TaxID=2839640 RepID=UPI001BE48E24|nr:MarR family transcriptional regulator [Actinomadura sp. NEAU-AAG7]MBT2207100.1 MarR family transcriptional regulator [Actinomadura sp. NEAU-AAG7]